ncbi:hypothetical protein [Roseibium sp. RKSG952]|uniref:hypothetical protein n=1 Tax=Roseibium sp. RKSG952 TaxID=2529384 RepID=UPI0012BC3AC4|nr:hypothetical protein [Roseibium sp. RKSG952]MTH99604.1 hypothetical protein [Roseibium sp. RKSG952]
MTPPRNNRRKQERMQESSRGDAKPLLVAITLGICVALSLTIAAAWASDPDFSFKSPEPATHVISAPSDVSSINKNKIQDRHPAFSQGQTGANAAQGSSNAAPAVYRMLIP